MKPTDEMSIAKHQERGLKSVRFFLEESDELAPDTSGSISIQIPNTKVRFDDPDFGGTTNYWCQGFKVDLPTDVQIIRVEPIIDPRNVKQIHHITAFVCPVLSDQDLAYSGGCYMSDTPAAIVQCNNGNLISVWAVGGAPFVFPENVGFPMVAGPTYLLMEVHYDNPTQVQVVDSSGFKFWYTNTPRPQMAGILNIGHATTPIVTIPPGQPAYTLTGWCAEQCTQNSFPPEGLKILSVFLHAHTLAAAIKLRLFRNGTELKTILDEPYYDFNYQDFTPVNVTLFPGDTLRVDCTYNSMSRTQPTPFGLSTREEMCVAFLAYWPKIDFIAASYEDPDYGLLGWCGEDIFVYQPPTFVPYIPPPCTRIAPDPNSLTPVLVSNPLDASKYDRSAFLDSEQKYKLYWKIDRTNLIIHGAVEVETTGWIGFGISKFGMEGADVFIGWIGEDGVPHLLDRFAEMKALPSVDQLQDYYDVTAGEIQSSSESSFPPWAIYTVGVVSGVLVVLAAVGIFLFVRSRRKTSYSALKESDPIYTRQEDVSM